MLSVIYGSRLYLLAPGDEKRPDRVAEALIKQIRRFCDGIPLHDKLDDAVLHAAWKQGPRQTFGTLTRWLIAHGDLPRELWRRLGELPRETAAAMFMAETEN